MNESSKNKTTAQSGGSSEVFLTVDEVAARLKISRTQVYKIVNKGDLTKYKVGKLGRYKVDEVDALAVPC